MEDESDDLSTGQRVQDKLSSTVSSLKAAGQSFISMFPIMWKDIVRRWRSISELSKFIITILLGTLVSPFIQDLIAETSVPNFQLPTVTAITTPLPEYFLSPNTALWLLTFMLALNSFQPSYLKITQLEKKIEKLERKLEDE